MQCTWLCPKPGGTAVASVGIRRPYAAIAADQPAIAASIAATSILRIVIIASNARRATPASGLLIASISTFGVICQDTPQWSLHQPQSLSLPPLPTMAFQ